MRWKKAGELEDGMVKRYVVPEGYLEGEVERVRVLTDKVETAGNDQEVIDEIYGELAEMMRQGLLEMKMKRGKGGQPWFTKEIAKLRKAFHRAEREWLECSGSEVKRGEKERLC